MSGVITTSAERYSTIWNPTREIKYTFAEGCGRPHPSFLSYATTGGKSQGIMRLGAYRPQIVDSLRGYGWSAFAKDAMAGTIVGIVALPLAIAFGIASGVSPEVGIFTAILGGLIVSGLGGTNVQIGGPTGAFIVIVYGIIQEFGLSGLIVATMMAGVILLLMAGLRLGTLIKFIPYPIVVGFTAGIAVTIFSTQMNDLLGLGLSDIPGSFFGKWTLYVQSLGATSWLALLFGILSILLIVLSPRVSERVPGSLVAIVVLTVAAYLLKQVGDVSGLECIGDRYQISRQLPRPVLPRLSFETLQSLVSPAFTIALLGAIESLLSASVADGVTGDRHRANTELVAQGVANIVVPLFGGIPVTGAIARTMTNINNGGRTPVAGIVHAVVLLLLLLFLAPLMDFIPMAVLAGVLIIVSYNMSGWRSVLGILRGPREDAAVMLLTFLLTVIFDLTIAIEMGLLLAMLLFMRRMIGTTKILVSDRALHLDPEERLAETQEEELPIPEGVLVYEIEGPYFFGIANRFEEAMSGVQDRSKVRIIRMRRVPFMDSSALYNLKNLIALNGREGIQVVLSGVSPEVMQTLERAGLVELIGQENVLGNIHAALRRAREIVGVEG